MRDDVSLRKTTEAENPAQHGDMRPSTAYDGGQRETTAPARAQNVPEGAPSWVPDDAPVEGGVCLLCDDFDDALARDVGAGGFRLGCGPACSCGAYMGGYLDAEADAAEAEEGGR